MMLTSPRSSRLSRSTIVILSCCALAGCQHSGSRLGSADSLRALQTDTVVDSRSNASALGDSVAPPSRVVQVALDGEGLRLVVQSSGSTRLLAFGNGASDVIGAVTTPLGATMARGTNADCGAGAVQFASFADGLSIITQQDRFIGWAARRSTTDRTMTTMSGIGVGSTRLDLDAVYNATVSRTTLGVEFAAGGIYGVLDGDGPSARITDLWAGTSCIAR